APAPESPSFCAAHSPSSLLRRAVALNRNSSSTANCISKPSSRLSNVVIASSLIGSGRVSLRYFARAARRVGWFARPTSNHRSRPCIAGRDRQGNRWRIDSPRWNVRNKAFRRDCAAQRDRLVCRGGRTACPRWSSRHARCDSNRSHGIQMDINKPRYTPMSRRRRIYEGKAKVLYEGPEPGTLIQHFKDDATAFNAKKHEAIEGKRSHNIHLPNNIYHHLNSIAL